MAYSKGFINEDGRETSQGVWILNFETGEERQIWRTASISTGRTTRRSG